MTTTTRLPGAPAGAFRLANGLLVLTREMRSAPVVSVYAWYRVGGRDDPNHRTGLSHWVEHMLFKATRAFPHGEIPRLLSTQGAHWDGFTWLDYTTCFATLPSDGLELMLRIEAERMTNVLMDADAVERERPILLAEREADEHTPSVILREATQQASFGARPYGRPAGGAAADLRAATREDVVAHYRRWYRPNNAVLVVVGDIEAERVHARAAHYFEALKSGRLPPRRSHLGEERPRPRRVTVSGHAPAPMLQIAFPIPAASHSLHLPVTVAATLLGGGRRSRLHRALVSSGFAVSVRAVAGMARESHLLTVDVTMWPNADRARAEALVLDEVQDLAHGTSVDELERAKRTMRNAFLLGTEGSGNQARLLGRYEMADSYTRFETYLEELEGVSVEDVERVARTYLDPETCTVGWLLPASNATSAARPLTASVGTAEHVHA